MSAGRGVGGAVEGPQGEDADEDIDRAIRLSLEPDSASWPRGSLLASGRDTAALMNADPKSSVKLQKDPYDFCDDGDDEVTNPMTGAVGTGLEVRGKRIVPREMTHAAVDDADLSQVGFLCEGHVPWMHAMIVF